MKTDADTNLQELKDHLEQFCKDRDWGQFHSAKDLAIGAVTEASELLEPFRFLTETQVEALMADPKKRIEIGDELADILFFVLRMAQKYNFDLSQSFQSKMAKNATRYPAESFRGKNHKA